MVYTLRVEAVKRDYKREAMTGESARDRAVTALALFFLSVLVHAATIPVSLGWLGALLLRNDVLALSPNTTFVYDDVPAIEQHKWIIDPSTDWRDLFTTRDFWGGELALTTSHKSYRPVTSLTYRLQVLWGSGSGGGGRAVNSVGVKRSLHVFNVLSFGVVTVCFYWVCLAVLSGRPLGGNMQRVSRPSPPP